MSRICCNTFTQFIFLPSTIHITMIFPPVATSSITANSSDQKSFCHHGRSNGRSWLTKIQSESAPRRISGRVDLFNTSSIKWRNSLRFSLKSCVILSSRTHALQLYTRSRVTLFIFRSSSMIVWFGELYYIILCWSFFWIARRINLSTVDFLRRHNRLIIIVVK